MFPSACLGGWGWGEVGGVGLGSCWISGILSMYSWVGPTFHGWDTSIRGADRPANISIVRLISAKTFACLFVHRYNLLHWISEIPSITTGRILWVAQIFYKMLPTIIENWYDVGSMIRLAPGKNLLLYIRNIFHVSWVEPELLGCDRSVSLADMRPNIPIGNFISDNPTGLGLQ